MGLGLAAGVGDGAEVGRADGRRVAPDGARLVVVAARLPLGFARGQLVVGQLDVERALLGIDGDDVAVLEQADRAADRRLRPDVADRSEEHTSELQSLMRISYAVFCLQKKKNPPHKN